MDEIFPFTCPNCGIVLKAPRNWVGKQARCKRCRSMFRLAEPDAAGKAAVAVTAMPPEPAVKAAVLEAVREERRLAAASSQGRPPVSVDDRPTRYDRGDAAEAAPPKSPSKADLHATRIDAAALDNDGLVQKRPQSTAGELSTKYDGTAEDDATLGRPTVTQSPGRSAPAAAETGAKTPSGTAAPRLVPADADTGSTDEGSVSEQPTVADRRPARADAGADGDGRPTRTERDDGADGDPDKTLTALRGAGLAALALGDDTSVEAPPEVRSGAFSLSAAPPAKYQVMRKLAQGGMGAVLIARDRDVNREVAMKVMLRPEQAGRDDLIRFVEEAQATGQLEHPNIVPVHDVGLDEKGRIYFTMKYVRGRSLKDVLEGLRSAGDASLREEFSLTRMLQIFIQVCNAVSFAHSRGVVHRDLKPANIMLGSYGEVMVMDWGLAKIVGRAATGGEPRVSTARSRSGIELTVNGMIAGTPQFMPPEQAAGKIAEIDPRSDVYALGAILYTMLTLKPPFQGPDAGSILTKVMVDPPEPFAPAPAYGGVPRELPAIALKALRKEKANRYQSAGEMAADVQRYLEGRSVTACPDGLLRRAWKWMKRHKAATLSTLAAVLVAAAAIGGTLGYQSWRAETARRDEVRARLKAGFEALLKNPYSRAVPSGVDDYASALQRRDVQEKIERSTQNLLAAVRELRRVLELDPPNMDARRSLLAAYLQLWQLAHDRRDAELMAAYAEEVRTYAGDAFEKAYAPRILGYGKLTLTVGNAAAEARLYRFEQFDGQYGRLVPVPLTPPQDGRPGVAAEPEKAGYARVNVEARQAVPRAAEGDFAGSSFRLAAEDAGRLGGGRSGEFKVEPLLPGSYLVVLRADGFEPLRVPVHVERHADGPGEPVELTVEMLPASAKVPGFTYVPRSNPLLGGQAAGALFAFPRRNAVEPFFIQTNEVSVADYFEFLEDLVKKGRRTDAEGLRPKSFDAVAASGAAREQDRRYLARITPEGRIEPLHGEWRKPIEELRTIPVSGVSWLDARAYIEWKSAKDGRKYRLPRDREWEVAARGVDGRTYTWGEIFRPEAAKLTQGYGALSEKLLAELRAAKCDYDESVYGVLDLAGSVAEWVEDKFVADNDSLRSIRGNAWGLTPTGLQCAFRTTGSSLNYFHITIGFRMALDAPPPGR